MTLKIDRTPFLPRVSGSRTVTALALFDGDLVKALYTYLTKVASRLNEAVTVDGADPMEAPLTLMAYAVADLPTAADNQDGLAMVTDSANGRVLTYCNGTNWVYASSDATVTV